MFGKKQESETGYEEADATNLTPDHVEYDDVDYQQSTRTPLLTSGWMLGEIIRGSRGHSKKGNLEVALKFAPVNGEGDTVSGVTTTYRAYPSIRNPKVPGHKAPRTVFFNWLFAKALGEEIAFRPTKVSKGVYADEDGQVMSQVAASAAYERVDKEVGFISAGWYNDPDALVGKRMYIFVEHTTTDDGRTFANIKKTLAINETPEGDLITSDFEVSAPAA